MSAESAAWLPPAASDVAARVDTLFYAMLALTGLVALGVFVVMIWFAVRYRRGSRADRSNPPVNNRVLELGWIFAPLAVFIAIFVWAAVVYAGFYRGDPAAMTIYVVGKQWMWSVEHANGRREIDELHLPLGQPVRLVLSSEDVIHSFFVPAFRIKQDAVPGRYTGIRFTPTKAGGYGLHCAEYCGTDHARMGGRVFVMAPAAFARWLEQGNPSPTLAAQGFEVFRRKGCSGCHAANSAVHAPELNGIFGRTVHLADGRTVRADEAYLRDSMLLPKRDVVAGYEPIMPSFQGQLDEGEIAALISYLKSTTGKGS
ncbi:MAG: cytochrome c oxidase subunit II [Betaproteobacteria bacterium]|nr:MAG: cytochrome c oxidase subunit II [Betaproteobacteria bacterium]